MHATPYYYYYYCGLGPNHAARRCGTHNGKGLHGNGLRLRAAHGAQ